MIALGAAHVGARLGFGDRHAGLLEQAQQRDDRRAAAMIDHRPRPIEDDGLDRDRHAAAPAVWSMRSAITSSASAKPVEAPVPLVTTHEPYAVGGRLDDAVPRPEA